MNLIHKASTAVYRCEIRHAIPRSFNRQVKYFSKSGESSRHRLKSVAKTDKSVSNDSDKLNQDLFVRKASFTRGRLLILKVDPYQGYFILVIVLVLTIALGFTFRKTYDCIKRRKSASVIFLPVSFLGVLFYMRALRNINSLIRKIWLLDDGKRIAVRYYFSQSVYDIAQFRRIYPNDNVLHPSELKGFMNEGFPVLVENRVKLISKQSEVYHRDLLAQIGKSQYVNII